MSTKYTPGPWEHLAIPGGWDGVFADGNTCICKLSYNNPDNAALISAAPDLLEVCKAILKEGGAGGCDCPDHKAIDRANELLWAAIAKAEGRNV